MIICDDDSDDKEDLNLFQLKNCLVFVISIMSISNMCTTKIFFYISWQGKSNHFLYPNYKNILIIKFIYLFIYNNSMMIMIYYFSIVLNRSNVFLIRYIKVGVSGCKLFTFFVLFVLEANNGVNSLLLVVWIDVL